MSHSSVHAITATATTMLVLLAACSTPTPAPSAHGPATMTVITARTATPGTTAAPASGSVVRSDDGNVTLTGLPAAEHWTYQPRAQYRQTPMTASRSYRFIDATGHRSQLVVTVSSPLTNPTAATAVVTGTGPDSTPALLAAVRRHVTFAPGAQFGPQPGAVGSSTGGHSH